MTEKHPGGLTMTKRLLAQSTLLPCKILDMGAGDGITVKYLLESGYDAWGIDLKQSVSCTFPRIYSGDFLHTPFSSESFDALISECAFYLSQDIAGALKESARILKRSGKLLLADVCFLPPDAYQKLITEAGFSIISFEDITPLWKEYYLSCIWDGTVSDICTSAIEGKVNGKCSYYLTICERT